jgi:hypothetical protein
VDDQHWQEIADQLISDAQLIVLRAGLTPGVLWEVERIRNRAVPVTFLLFLDDVPARGRPLKGIYREFRESVRNVLRSDLPADPAGVRFFRFDENWMPTPLAPRLPMKSFSIHLGNEWGLGAMKRELMPLFKKNDASHS